MTQPPQDPFTPAPDEQGAGAPVGDVAPTNPQGVEGAAAPAAHDSAAPGSDAPFTGDVLPTAAPRRSRRGLIIGAVTVVAVGIIAAGGYAAYGFLSGGGAQPEDVVSADALAFVKVDLDPAAGQKVAIARLAQRFDDSASGESGDDDPRELFADVLGGLTSTDVDYAADVEPWIGNRAAVAIVPQPDASIDELVDSARPLIAIAVDDEGAAQESLARLYPAGSDWTVAFREGYALVGDARTTAAPAVALAQDPAFTGTEAAIGDTVAFAYVDVEAGLDIAENLVQTLGAFVPDVGALTGNESGVASEFGNFEQLASSIADAKARLAAIPTTVGGRTLGIGVSAQPEGVDITVRAFGLTEALPANTAPVALSDKAVGAAVVQGYGDYVKSAVEGLDAVAPDADAETVLTALGTQVAVQVGVDAVGEPVVQAVIEGDDPAAIEAAWQTLAFEGDQALEITNNGTNVTVGTPGARDAFVDATSGERVTTLLPDASTAAAYAFVDIAAIRESPAASEVDDFGDLSQLGLSVSGPTAGDATVRLALRF